jgi:hypothetical protein
MASTLPLYQKRPLTAATPPSILPTQFASLFTALKLKPELTCRDYACQGWYGQGTPSEMNQKLKHLFRAFLETERNTE